MVWQFFKAGCRKTNWRQAIIKQQRESEMRKRTDRRMAIPFHEIEQNLVTNGAASTRYSRRSTFISEAEADARSALGMMIMAAICFIFLCFALWAVFFAIGKAEAHSGHIYAKSEMTKAEIKALNVMPAKGERHAR